MNFLDFGFRFRYAVRAAVVHMLLSAAVAVVVATLVFVWWFPSPLRELMGGTQLFWLIVGVDVVCGPLLTLVVFNPAKPRAELRRDIALVALIQLLALGYGLHAVSHARPVALVYEVDRMRAVSYADIAETELPSVPDWANPWRLTGPLTVGLREVVTTEEKIASIESSLGGIEPGQRPSWWQDYALSVPKVLERARALAELRAKHPTQAERLNIAAQSAIDNWATGETSDPESLLWLPLVSRHVNDWVVLLDPATARVRGYAHVDGF